VGHKHTKEEILEGAVAVAFADGVSQLTFGRVAKRLGISDRIVVYYFPSKDDLVGDVLGALGLQLMEALAPAVSSPVSDHLHLVRAVWPVLARAESDPVFALSSKRVGRRPPASSPTAPWCPSSSTPGSPGPPSSSTEPRVLDAPRPKRPSR
jgi:AcrR family transcriptional regulator